MAPIPSDTPASTSEPLIRPSRESAEEAVRTHEEFFAGYLTDLLASYRPHRRGNHVNVINGRALMEKQDQSHFFHGPWNYHIGGFQMSKLLSILIASAFAAALSFNVAAADATKAEVKTEKAGATEMKKGAQAESKETKATAAATEKKTDAKADYKLAEKTAKADYKAASADCKKKPAAEQKACLKDAKAAEKKAIGDAKETMVKAQAEAKAAKKAAAAEAKATKVKAGAEATATKEKAKAEEKTTK